MAWRHACFSSMFFCVEIRYVDNSADSCEENQLIAAAHFIYQNGRENSMVSAIDCMFRWRF